MYARLMMKCKVILLVLIACSTTNSAAIDKDDTIEKQDIVDFFDDIEQEVDNIETGNQPTFLSLISFEYVNMHVNYLLKVVKFIIR